MNLHAAVSSLVLAAGIACQALAAEPPEPTYGYPSPEAARAAINGDEAAKARRQLAENASNRQSYEQATAAREEQIEVDQAAWQAEKSRLASEHEAAMAAWRADVAACRGGDRTHCKH